MPTSYILLVVALGGLFFSAASRAGEDDEHLKAMDKKIRATDRPEAPDLLGATSWINVDKPLTLADLKGKVVLLDFWTFG